MVTRFLFFLVASAELTQATQASPEVASTLAATAPASETAPKQTEEAPTKRVLEETSATPSMRGTMQKDLDIPAVVRTTESAMYSDGLTMLFDERYQGVICFVAMICGLCLLTRGLECFNFMIVAFSALFAFLLAENHLKTMFPNWDSNWRFVGSLEVGIFFGYLALTGIDAIKACLGGILGAYLGVFCYSYVEQVCTAFYPDYQKGNDEAMVIILTFTLSVFVGTRCLDGALHAKLMALAAPLIGGWLLASAIVSSVLTLAEEKVYPELHDCFCPSHTVAVFAESLLPLSGCNALDFTGTVYQSPLLGKIVGHQLGGRCLWFALFIVGWYIQSPRKALRTGDISKPLLG